MSITAVAVTLVLSLAMLTASVVLTINGKDGDIWSFCAICLGGYLVYQVGFGAAV